MKSRIVPSLLSGIAALLLAALPVRAQRSGYAHVTDVDGAGSVLSDANGRTDIQVNLPLAEGDQLVTNAGGHAEIELADGNRVQVAGESRVRLDALAGEDGSDAEESAITLLEGSLAAESAPSSASRAFRIDTADASVYVPSQGRVRVNLDPARGTSVIVRAGSADVQTRSGAITVEAGQYVLVHGDEQAELARGSFSRDRFDVWVADRTETVLAAHNSVSAQYVDGDDYDQDVASLDGYGSWDYSPTYDTEVWRPDVGADWSPYSDGYWYYTPVGASWVSNEPWGWFPHHYGNWFFDAAFGSWCWSPAFAYSPGWVYWGFSPGYVGWCPIGYYSYYGPYSHYWGGYGGWHSGLYFSVCDVFDRGHVDWHQGWNFVGDHSFGSRFDHGSVLPGSAVASRLGSRVAITSDRLRPAMVSGRGSAVTALRSYVRTAPATIARQSSPERAAALTPFLGRQATLPASTVRVLQDRQLARVDPTARRLEGPGAERLAAAPSSRAIAGSPRLSGGSFRTPGSTSRSESWRSSGRSTGGAAPRITEGRSLPPSVRSRSGSSSPGTSPRSDGRSADWRRPTSPSSRSAAPRTEPRSAAPRANTETWRQRPGSSRGYASTPPRSGRFGSAPGESWRTRANTPPAQRVIEGIDRGRAVPPPRNEPYIRSLPGRSSTFEPREIAPTPRYQRSVPPAYGRSPQSAPPSGYQRSAPPNVRGTGPSAGYSRPAPAPSPGYQRSAPAPSPRSSPPSAPQYRAPAPAPRPAPPPRSAPPPSRGGEYHPSHGRSH